MSRVKDQFRGGALLLAGLLLSACPGSGTHSQPHVLSGVASGGLALGNRGVLIRDATGATRTTGTDANGTWSADVQGLAYPYMLQISSTQGFFHSLYTSADDGKPANISDDTDSIAQLALGVTRNEDLEQVFFHHAFGSVTDSGVAAADQAFLARVKSDFDGASALLTESPRTRSFQPGTVPGGGDDYARLMAQVSLAPDGKGGFASLNVKPDVIGDITNAGYDGVSDDLLTGGLGKSGLMKPAPAFANPASPTASELRRNAIHTNYRALIDFTANGGFGTLYGPNVDKDGNVTSSEGLIAGMEYLAYADDGSGQKNVTVMVQVPSTFDTAHPCIVTGTSSGSRGVYGHIGVTGEWGLKRGCAVTYSDKGTGNGLDDLQNGTVGLINGLRTTAAAAGRASHFTARLNPTELAAFNAATPNRVAFKHAHSQQNPEKDWGRNTLDSVLFAFYVLNEQFVTTDSANRHLRTVTPANTLVLAAGVSNGGGSVLAAAEQDKLGLIDGVVAGEPQIQVASNQGLTIKQGANTIATHSKPLLDFDTYAGLYQPCAALSTAAAGSPGAFLLSNTSATNRCTALKAKGLLSGDTTTDQANDALDRLLAYGWLPDSNPLQLTYYRLAVPAVVATYANAYGRFSVQDNLCGFSYGNTDSSGNPVPQATNTQLATFATANGIPSTSSANVIFNDSVGGPKQDVFATSPSTNLIDYVLDGALCHRSLVTGVDPVTGNALTGAALDRSNRVRAGIAEVLAGGNLQGKPTILVHGRSDALEPVNHTSRAYYGKNMMVEGAGSKVRYYEVTNAQHFDAFIASPVTAGYDTRFVPLHVYFIQSMNLMASALRSQTALPPSQVVRTTPRGGTPGAAPPITPANVPPIPATPAAADQISFSGSTLTIPD